MELGAASFGEQEDIICKEEVRQLRPRIRDTDRLPISLMNNIVDG